MTELFEKFEIDRRSRWPMMTRLLGGSIVLHFILLLCVLYVPSVRNALNLATMFSDTSYVDRAYSKTQIGDRAEILNLPKFQYPEGYFAPATPAPDPMAAQIVASAPPMIGPPMMPKTTPIPVPPPTTTIPAPSPSTAPAKSDDPSKIVTADAKSTEGKTPQELEAEMNKIADANKIVRPNEEEVNTRPLKDWLANANTLRNTGKLDLSKTVEVVISAELDPAGKLINPTVTRKSGDEAMAEVAKDLVSEINDSNALIFLTKEKENGLGGRKVIFTVKLDQTEVLAKVESEAESPQRAEKMASGFNLLLLLGQKLKDGKDEGVIYKNTKVSSNGNQIIVNFAMPRSEAGEIIKKHVPPAT
jgi:hypothetical protein